MTSSLWSCHDTSDWSCPADAIVLILAGMLLAGCILVPPPATRTGPERSARSAQPEAQVPCVEPNMDVEIVHAAWAYVHDRYPLQPWPNDVYLVGDRNMGSPCQDQPVHVVLFSHATGFLWEGEIVWSRNCPCCRVQIEEIREVYAAMSAADVAPTVHP